MTLAPEAKRSGFNPNQPRDRKGRWVETGAEVRNSITHAVGTVTKIMQGDRFHETTYEVRDHSGGTQHWQQSAVDVIKNPDGSAPSSHKPGGSAVADHVGHVYAGQAPPAPAEGRSPVSHAVDAAYGAPHPDQPGAARDAIHEVYAGQAPTAPQGRPSVAHAVDAVYAAPADGGTERPAAADAGGTSSLADAGEVAEMRAVADRVPVAARDRYIAFVNAIEAGNLDAARTNMISIDTPLVREDSSSGREWRSYISGVLSAVQERSRRGGAPAATRADLPRYRTHDNGGRPHVAVPAKIGNRWYLVDPNVSDGLVTAWSLSRDGTVARTAQGKPAADVDRSSAGQFPGEIQAERVAAGGRPESQVLPEPPGGRPAISPSPSPEGGGTIDRVEAARRMFGEGSPQHQEAQRRFGADGGPNVPDVTPAASGAPDRETLLRQQRESASLDDRWRMVGAGDFSSSVSKLRAGDAILTQGEGTQADPVELPRRAGGSVGNSRRLRGRTVSRVERNDDGTSTVHFTDGTSTGTEGGAVALPNYTGRTAVYAAYGRRKPADAPTGGDQTGTGGTPGVPPPAPAQASLDDLRAAWRTQADDINRSGTGGIGGHTMANSLRIMADSPDSEIEVSPDGEFVAWRGSIRDARTGLPLTPPSENLETPELRASVMRAMSESGVDFHAGTQGDWRSDPAARERARDVVKRAIADARQGGGGSNPLAGDAQSALDALQAARGGIRGGSLANADSTAEQEVTWALQRLARPDAESVARQASLVTLASALRAEQNGGVTMTPPMHTHLDALVTRGSRLEGFDPNATLDSAENRRIGAVNVEHRPANFDQASRPLEHIDHLQPGQYAVLPNGSGGTIEGYIDSVYAENGTATGGRPGVSFVPEGDATIGGAGTRTVQLRSADGNTLGQRSFTPGNLSPEGARVMDATPGMPPAPGLPDGTEIAARDLNIGDHLAYALPDGNLVTGRVEGMHTTGAQTVVTLRGDDDATTTHAFASEATVVRTANVADKAPTEDVAAGDLKPGHRIVVPDATGTYRPATVLAKAKDPDGGGISLEVVRDGGQHETVHIDPAEMLPRVTDSTVPPEPDLPDPLPDPVVDPPQPEDGTKFARDLQPGDRLRTYGDTITVLRSRVSPDGQSVTARIRLANGSEDDVPFGPDAVVTLADPPDTVDVEPHPTGTVAARPVLYTYQRNAVTALNLDDPAHPTSSPGVAQAAARVRARQALSEEQNAALADALRAQAAAPGVRAPRQRSLQRQAAAFDAAAAALAGREPPALPNQGTVQKTRPGNLVEGDWVALRGQGVGGTPEAVQVLDMRQMMGGRLHELTVRDADGNTSTRLVAGNADTYLLPDLPRDLPAPPEQPQPEHISGDRLVVGDTIRATVPNQDGAYPPREVRVTAIERIEDTPDYMVTFGDVVAEGRPWRTEIRGGGVRSVVRTARGPASQDQPYDSLLPTENPEPLTSIRDVNPGDRVTITRPYGATTGTIQEIDHIDGPDGRKGARLTGVRDDGGAFTLAAFDGTADSVTRLSKGDPGFADRVAAAKEESARQQQASRVAANINNFRLSALNDALTSTELGRGTFDREYLAQQIDRLRATDSGQGVERTSRAIAGLLHPDDPGMRDALAPQIATALKQARDEDFANLSASVAQAIPMGDETDAQAIMRVVEQWRDTPPGRDMGAVARTLVDASRGIDNSGNTGPQIPTVNVPEGADLATRIKAYREALPSGEAFGKARTTRTTYKVTSLDDLEAGRIPETTTTTVLIDDEAPDGGPGATAMAHHDILVAAGADMDAELGRQITAYDPGLGDDPEATIASLTDEQKQAQQAAERAFTARLAARNRAMPQALEGSGYTDIQRLEGDLAKYRARVKYGRPPAPGSTEQSPDQAQLALLNALHGQVYDRLNAAIQPELDAENEAGTRAKAARERLADFHGRYLRARRESAIKLIAEHRAVGGERLTWKNPTTGKAMGETGEVVKAMRTAEAAYPTDWLRRFQSHFPQGLRLKKVKRGHYNGREIALSEKRSPMKDASNMDGVAVHELGHAMEAAVPGVMAAERAFLWSRTASGPIGSRTQETQSMIHLGEYGWKDGFPDHYTGKDYKGVAYEVLTTGVEDLFGGQKYLDDHFRRWLLGSLTIL